MIVYSIRNTVNNKLYIGSTIRKLGARWSQHKSEAARGKGSSATLYEAMRIYGPDAFELKVIHRTEDPDELAAKEAEFIRDCRSDDPGFGYNRTHTGAPSGGYNAKVQREMHERRLANAPRGPLVEGSIEEGWHKVRVLMGRRRHRRKTKTFSHQ